MMKNDVKVLKLVTGEELITRVTKREVDLITIDKPMKVQSIKTKQGERWSATLIPWMKVAKCEKITISTEYILAEDDPVEEAEKDYLSIVTGLTL